MQLQYILKTLAALAGLLLTPVAATSQAADNTVPHVPLQKAIGHTKSQVVPSLIVLNSKGAMLLGGKLTLFGVTPNAFIFADRPVRAAGHDLTANIIEDWNKGSDNFDKDPPNTTVSSFSKDGKSIKDVVVVLKRPKLEDDRLTFEVDVLEGPPKKSMPQRHFDTTKTQKRQLASKITREVLCRFEGR